MIYSKKVRKLVTILLIGVFVITSLVLSIKVYAADNVVTLEIVKNQAVLNVNTSEDVDVTFEIYEIDLETNESHSISSGVVTSNEPIVRDLLPDIKRFEVAAYVFVGSDFYNVNSGESILVTEEAVSDAKVQTEERIKAAKEKGLIDDVAEAKKQNEKVKREPTEQDKKEELMFSITFGVIAFVIFGIFMYHVIDTIKDYMKKKRSENAK